MAEWSAEVTVDEPLVRRLIGGQFPALELQSVEPFAEGWDNAVWRVDGDWLFRFPRRAIAVPGVRRQMAVLPWLAPRLPLPVPAPRFLGAPTDGFPWPFFGCAFLPGVEIGDAGAGDDVRRAWARPLGLFCALPDGARADFLDEDGPVGGARLLRARVLAAFLCATLAVYARHEGMDALRREAIAGLERTFA